MSSWKARLLMVLTILTMLLAMSAAPAMANDFDGFGFPDHRSGFLGDFRDDCHHFDCDDDDEGAELVSLAPGECIAVVDEDHPSRSKILCAPGVAVV
jgi:hypothetical protein